MTILNWVNNLGKKAKSPIHIANELQPQWGGILGIDGKPLKISGQERTVLIAVDITTHDPFYFLLAEAEDIENTKTFLLIIKEVFKYPIKAIVSDFGKGKVFIDLIEKIFPGIPHQVCAVHFSRYVDMRLPKSKKSQFYHENKLLRSLIKQILFSDKFADVDELFQEFLKIEHIFTKKYQKEIIKSLKKNYDLLTTHFLVEGLPRDTNIVENIIKQLNRKLMQTNGFGNESNVYNFLKLWFTCYRFHPFTCSRYPERNGRCPLSIANSKGTPVDWLKYSVQNSNS